MILMFCYLIVYTVQYVFKPFYFHLKEQFLIYLKVILIHKNI